MKCPCCNGNGGEVEAVLDYGQGPYYPCGFCNDKTTVGFFKWLQWKIWEHEYLVESNNGFNSTPPD